MIADRRGGLIATTTQRVDGGPDRSWLGRIDGAGRVGWLEEPLLRHGLELRWAGLARFGRWGFGTLAVSPNGEGFLHRVRHNGMPWWQRRVAMHRLVEARDGKALFAYRMRSGDLQVGKLNYYARVKWTANCGPSGAGVGYRLGAAGPGLIAAGALRRAGACLTTARNATVVRRMWTP